MRQGIRLLGILGLWTALSAPTPAEEISPQPVTPAEAEPGLSRRAIPLPPEIDADTYQADRGYVPLYRVTAPFYDSVFAVHPAEPPMRPDPSAYHDVTAYEPPVGLQPTPPKRGLFTMTPFAGVTQTYDSNIALSSDNHLGDTYTTLTAGTDFQLGTPDSIYNERYDSMLALHGHYLFSSDIFSELQQFNAVNNKINLEGRIGRDSAIWRPYVAMEEFTSTDFEDRNNEEIGRIQRQVLAPGVRGDYQISPRVTYSDNFSWTHLEHPQQVFIDTDQWTAEQEVGYRVLNDFDLLVWNELRQTEPSNGAAANEVMGGFGWRGKPDPRLFTELHIGWSAMHWSDPDPGRRSLSQWRISGHTTFDWTPRLRLTLKYDRDYTFNEVAVNDNYTSTAIQGVAEVFLGGNFYLTPYIAVTDYAYERDQLEQIEWRAETELAYRLPPRLGTDSRLYIKGAWLRTDRIHGEPHSDTVEDVRISMASI